MSANTLTLHLCPLAALDDTLRRRYRETLLADDEIARLAGFSRRQAADQLLVGRALLRSVLSERLQRAPRTLAVDRDEPGKPRLRDGEGWFFNLSHSRDWVVLALGRGGEIGVDIESSERRNDIDGIARRFFRPDEAAWLQTLPDARRRFEFFRMWTLKEATVKALGRGISGTLIDVGVQVDGDSAQLHLHGGAARSPAPRYWHGTFDAQRYHLAVVALPDSNAEIALPPQLFRHLPLESVQPLATDDIVRIG